MKLKKFSALILATAMVAGSIAGCGTQGGSSSSAASSSAEATKHLNAAILMKAHMPDVKDSYSDCWQSMRFGETDAQ